MRLDQPVDPLLSEDSADGSSDQTSSDLITCSPAVDRAAGFGRASSRMRCVTSKKPCARAQLGEVGYHLGLPRVVGAGGAQRTPPVPECSVELTCLRRNDHQSVV